MGLVKVVHYPELGEARFFQGKRQRHIRISLKPQYIRVSYPRRLAWQAAEKFLMQRKDWVLANRPEAPVISSGMAYGRLHTIVLVDKRLRPYIKDHRIRLPKNLPAVERDKILKKALQAESQAVLKPMYDDLAESFRHQTGLKAEQVRFKFMTSRWGSCDSRATVTLNSGLVHLPDELVAYVIRHELCHLKHPDHSADFWRFLGAIEADLAERRAEIKQYQPSLLKS